MLEDFGKRQKVGLFMGPVLFILVLVLPVPEGLSVEAARVGAVALLMACFWMAETVPIPVTATLPIILFPLLRIMPTADVTVSYGEEILFLFMGGFIIAIAMQRWRLHRRIALNVINLVGSSPARLVLGFMLATALLSMWISNTATAMMMMPVAMAVIEQTRSDASLGDIAEDEHYPFAIALMLAIAYSASIGGVATLVGTPPNAIFVGLLDSLYGLEISFVDWMKLAVPVSVSMLFICWLLLTKILFRMPSNTTDSLSVHRHITQELQKLGVITSEEKRVACIFALVASAWILRGLFKPAMLSMVADSAIAMTGAFLLFIVPRGDKKPGMLLEWKTAATIPWDIIVLMGGGFALAEGFKTTGLTEWLANQLGILQNMPAFALVLVVVLFVTFLTEMTSNAATATLFIPVMGALAVSMGLHPLVLMVPTAIAASMAFMLPVATPPNAIVFGSRMVTIRQMVSAGIWLNLLGALIVSFLCYELTDILL